MTEKQTSKTRRLSISAFTASSPSLGTREKSDKVRRRSHSRAKEAEEPPPRPKEKRKSVQLPLLDTSARANPVPQNPLMVATQQQPPPSTERSPSSTASSPTGQKSSPKDVPRNVYTRYNERGDLLSSFSPRFDPAQTKFCFQCGVETDALTTSVEFTSFQFPDTRIYRPILSCDQCVAVMAERKAANATHRVHILERVIAFYEKTPLLSHPF